MLIDTAQVLKVLIKERGIRNTQDHAARLLSTIRVVPRPVQPETP